MRIAIAAGYILILAWSRDIFSNSTARLQLFIAGIPWTQFLSWFASIIADNPGEVLINLADLGFSHPAPTLKMMLAKRLSPWSMPQPKILRKRVIAQFAAFVPSFRFSDPSGSFIVSLAMFDIVIQCPANTNVIVNPERGFQPLSATMMLLAGLTPCLSLRHLTVIPNWWLPTSVLRVLCSGAPTFSGGPAGAYVRGTNFFSPEALAIDSGRLGLALLVWWIRRSKRLCGAEFDSLPNSNQIGDVIIGAAFCCRP